MGIGVGLVLVGETSVGAIFVIVGAAGMFASLLGGDHGREQQL
jgi:hypothetical protein